MAHTRSSRYERRKKLRMNPTRGNELAEVAKALTAIAEGRCPQCGGDVASEWREGKCVYANPCGHRSHQGRARTVEQLQDARSNRSDRTKRT